MLGQPLVHVGTAPGLCGDSRPRLSGRAKLDSLSRLLPKPPTIPEMQKKIFWMVFLVLGLLADFVLPFWWAFFATVPILFISWWVAYRSDWF